MKYTTEAMLDSITKRFAKYRTTNGFGIYVPLDQITDHPPQRVTVTIEG